MPAFALQVFLGFFAIMNPFGNVPIFLGLVEGLSETDAKKVALKSTTTAFSVVLVFALGGNLIFRLFGISLSAFRIAGGVLIFAIAYQLLNGRKSHQHHLHQNETEEHEDPTDIGITPLGIPILAGPGTITTAMSFVGKRADWPHIFLVLGVFAAMCLITYFFFVYSEMLIQKIGLVFMNLLSRLMGLILAVVAVQMILIGVQQALQAF